MLKLVMNLNIFHTSDSGGVNELKPNRGADPHKDTGRSESHILDNAGTSHELEHNLVLTLHASIQVYY